MKIVISAKGSKTVQKEIDAALSPKLYGKKIGDKIEGSDIGLEGYEFQITGGSDLSGFPMRSDVTGTLRKRIFTTRSLGVHLDRRGTKVRKSVAGNTVFEKTAQINAIVTKQGKEPLVAPEAPAEAAAAA